LKRKIGAKDSAEEAQTELLLFCSYFSGIKRI